MNREPIHLEDCLHFLLSTAQNKVAAAYKARLAAADVTPSQAGVLSCLWDKDGIAQKQIAERMMLEGPTVSGIVDRLEKKGIVTRRVNEENRREMQVWLTDMGRALRPAVKEATTSLNLDAFNGFSDEEVETFCRMLWYMMKTEF